MIERIALPRVPGDWVCGVFVREPETHCPACGFMWVYVEDGEGDYYLGPTFVCCACGATGHCWAGQRNAARAQRLQAAARP